MNVKNACHLQAAEQVLLTVTHRFTATQQHLVRPPSATLAGATADACTHHFYVHNTAILSVTDLDERTAKSGAISAIALVAMHIDLLLRNAHLPPARSLGVRPSARLRDRAACAS